MTAHSQIEPRSAVRQAREPGPAALIASRALWPLRDLLAQTDLVTPLAPWEWKAPVSGRMALWDEAASRRAAGRTVLVRPGPLWRLSASTAHVPLGLSIVGPGSRPEGKAPDHAEAKAIIDRVVTDRLSRSNDRALALPEGISPPSLLIAFDGRRGDASALLREMALQAADEAAGDRILAIDEEGRVFRLRGGGIEEQPAAARISGWALLEEADAVFTAEEEIGFHALMLGRKVVCFDRLSYAGQGLTEDRFGGASPEAGASLDALVLRRYRDEAAYFDPWTRRLSDFHAVAGQTVWLRDRFFENDRPTFCFRMTRWKRRTVERFLDGPHAPVQFVRFLDDALRMAKESGGRIVTWETQRPPEMEPACAEAGIPLLRMEDGFIRSVGLGVSRLPGASIVLDSRGIHFDPERPSALEDILNAGDIDTDTVRRAQALRKRIVELHLSKYNVGRSPLPGLPADRRIVLVPGQVEDDASIKRGAYDVRTNLELLRRARQRNPDDYVIFKPHPDVAGGYRIGEVPEEEAARLADLVVTDVSIADVLARADHVETMTSLAGFEALLRGKTVTAHGRPFYAGWGLTEDLAPIERRSRTLTLDELVAGALILYPLYIDPRTGLRCPPEALVDILAEAMSSSGRVPLAKQSALFVFERAFALTRAAFRRTVRRYRK